MVAEFLRLKFRLLGNATKRSTSSLIGLFIALAYAVIMAVVLIWVLTGLNDDDPDFVRNVVVISGSFVTAGFLLVPVIFSVPDRMDPRAFALYGVSDGRIASGLAVTAIFSVPSLVIIAVSLSTVVTWSRSPGIAFIAVVAAVLGAVTCVLGARLSLSIAAFVFDTRRAREIGAVVGVLALFAVVPGILLLMLTQWGRDGGGFFSALESILGWTPFGAAWAAPADAANGEWVVSVLKLLIAAATLALIWLAWRGLVSLMLVTPGRQELAREQSGLGWFGRTPTTPTGAVAARSLTYWGRDARYYAQLAIVPFVPLLTVIVFAFVGVPAQYAALLPVPLMCVFLGWAVHNDVAFDNTAIWLHVVAGRLGVADRIGRMIPIVLIAIPLIGIGSFLSILFAGTPDALPAVLGVSTCLVLTGLGLGSIFSARFPYAATRPGDSAFTQPQSTGATSVLAQTFSLLGTLVFSAPSVILAVMGVFGGDIGYLWASLWTGLAVGGVVLIGGIAWGAHLFNVRGPEILAAAQRN
ncbi:MAG: hypothetical protein EPO52_02325 [Herbiconiux sp.]|uniref:hypothetical protein n=1 Tax=Herbiconiux sp. TaxID=1871186 RepID=UPI0011FA656C|nr:hypothetical protein [Herbiconiux sp.]TAJ49803.1 MAG: hypothetical protein EPO52_02325 [Herbiconiux sp.]